MNLARKCPTCGGVFAGDVCPTCASGPMRIGTGTQPELPKRFRGFDLLEPLGKGGMGLVFKARQPSLDRSVALKILPPEKAEDLEFQGRFEREAKALASLSHPNILTIYDFGHEGGFYFFAMEFVEGSDLRRRMKERKLAPADAVAVADQICAALEYAHGRGIIHRDIKPENVLLDSQNRVKLADFGLAKLAGTAADAHRLTQSSAAMGTLNYIAPEQMEDAANADHRSDLYSLGVLLYEMLTGGLPVGKFDPPSKISSSDVRLDAIVLRALEKDPQRRPQSATELRRELERLGRSSPSPVSRPFWPLVAATIVLVGGGVALLVTRPWKRTPEIVQPPTSARAIDPERIQFGPYEGPFNYPYLDPHRVLPENPLIARDLSKMDLVANFLRSVRVSSVSRNDLRYGYVVSWYNGSLIVLDCANGEELEREFKKGRGEQEHWTYRDGSVLILAMGEAEAVADLWVRVRKKLGLPG